MFKEMRSIHMYIPKKTIFVLLKTIIFGHEKHLYFSQDMQVKQDLGLFGLLHCGLLGDVEAVKELLISLFFTVVDCWMRAADWDTASMEWPWTISSSFWPLLFSTVTPGCILTFLMNFSPPC